MYSMSQGASPWSQVIIRTEGAGIQMQVSLTSKPRSSLCHAAQSENAQPAQPHKHCDTYKV